MTLPRVERSSPVAPMSRSVEATGSRRSGFSVGDRVVHPGHGAGKVVTRGPKNVLGSSRDYLEIEMADASLRILIPCDATAAVGLRPIVSPRAMRRIVKILESEPEPVTEAPFLRQRRNLTRCKSGDVFDLSAVIRDLVRRAADTKLSPGEKLLLERSRAILGSELRYALGVSVEQADRYIDEHVNARAASAHPLAAGPG